MAHRAIRYTYKKDLPTEREQLELFELFIEASKHDPSTGCGEVLVAFDTIYFEWQPRQRWEAGHWKLVMPDSFCDGTMSGVGGLFYCFMCDENFVSLDESDDWGCCDRCGRSTEDKVDVDEYGYPLAA